MRHSQVTLAIILSLSISYVLATCSSYEISGTDRLTYFPNDQALLTGCFPVGEELVCILTHDSGNYTVETASKEVNEVVCRIPNTVPFIEYNISVCFTEQGKQVNCTNAMPILITDPGAGEGYFDFLFGNPWIYAGLIFFLVFLLALFVGIRFVNEKRKAAVKFALKTPPQPSDYSQIQFNLEEI